MIGYYVHHQGHGHLHRALAVAARMTEPVTLLSSLPRPGGWAGEWVSLERDDLRGSHHDVDARGRLHWVPLGDEGLSRRMRQLSDWIDRTRPRLLVSDVSVEVALLARLHGCPILTVVPPGRRSDPAHLLGFDISEELVGFWPAGLTDALLPGLADEVRRRVRTVGALSRFPVEPKPGPRRPGPPRVTLMSGSGGSDAEAGVIDRMVRATPDWEWIVLGPGNWTDDPREALRSADVVITHAGQNALAEVAALRRPAIVVPQARPHDEQLASARVLAGGDWPAVVVPSLTEDDWSSRLTTAAALDGRRWDGWCDGRAAQRFAALLGAGARMGAA